MGDAELDEGNIYEALIEGYKHDVRNRWWIVDYNRQSLDAVIRDRLFEQFDSDFPQLRLGRRRCSPRQALQAAFAEPGGEALQGVDRDCPNPLYSALGVPGRGAWRRRLEDDLGDQADRLGADRTAQR